ncbi:MAG: 1-deoxy-D-xylulose-5-phosphate synthase [Bacteroidales bacterium]|nr:1-deoxy-D-xylulose-5-phosphate synthase [Bacteroidales bacterium]
MFLEKVNSPEDIRGLSVKELAALCKEVRDYMIECCSSNPGHIGSSLGAVEIITAVHYVFNTPSDKLIFDVSHQSYAHKILTGRREQFRTLRSSGGLAGFACRDESPYDCFGGGHSSNSISAAAGFAEAALLKGTGDKTVCIIGDGALTGGEAYEGLNNLGGSDKDVLIIINDNNFSISRNIGGMHEYLLHITTGRMYNTIKEHVWNRVGDSPVRRLLSRVARTTKSFFVKKTGGDAFEALGFRYFGPVDGNDIGQMVKVLRRLKNLHGPLILHAVTTKGKGFAPAEEDQATWHAPGAFDPETGKRKTAPSASASRYQDVFGETLLELARADSSVVGVTPAMSLGCGMNLLATEMPERFFDVGIAEQHAVTFSAALAAAGMRPFCNIYSAFSQRAYDQIIHDIALQRLPVVLCFDRAGLVGEDGATHNGVFDITAYRSIPGAVIAAPSDEMELRNMMFTALASDTGPFIIRYPRGYGEGVPWRGLTPEILPVGRGVRLSGGDTVAVFACGPLVGDALRALEALDEETASRVRVYNMRYVKPLDESLLEDAAGAGCRTFITLEDAAVKGGLFSAVAEWTAMRGKGIRVVPLGVGDEFIPHASQRQQHSQCGIDVPGIAAAIKAAMENSEEK